MWEEVEVVFVFFLSAHSYIYTLIQLSFLTYLNHPPLTHLHFFSFLDISRHFGNSAPFRSSVEHTYTWLVKGRSTTHSHVFKLIPPTNSPIHLLLKSSCHSHLFIHLSIKFSSLSPNFQKASWLVPLQDAMDLDTKPASTHIIEVCPDVRVDLTRLWFRVSIPESSRED